MLFAESLDTLRDVVAGNLPIAVGGVVTVLVLTLLAVQHLRRSAQATPALVPPVSPTGVPVIDEKSLDWAPPEQSYADRRGSVRREGGPVRVLVASPTFRNGMGDGFVVDRSTGGLRVLMQTAMAPGTTIQVKAVNAPDTTAFVSVIVRSCRKTGDHFELGCEFEKTPPWNVLLLFG